MYPYKNILILNSVIVTTINSGLELKLTVNIDVLIKENFTLAGLHSTTISFMGSS